MPTKCRYSLTKHLYFGIAGGDVAFVKHTTVRENTDGRNRAEWARNRRSDDYELLCNDGTRRNIDAWEDCNMGEIPSNAIVTAGKEENNGEKVKEVAVICYRIRILSVGVH